MFVQKTLQHLADSYRHTLRGHPGRSAVELEPVPACSQAVVADEVLQAAGAEGRAAVEVLQDGVAVRAALRGGHCRQTGEITSERFLKPNPVDSDAEMKTNLTEVSSAET